MAAVPSIGRATRVDRPVAPGAAAAGDLYERYSGQILGYCLHQLGSREEAEDAVQTTFMNAFRGLQRGIVPELESAWLFKIAHNVCLSRRRSSWRRGKVEAPNNFEVLQEVVPGREQVADELIRLPDVLEAMPETQRRAILLREWQGLTYREISTELGLSQAAVETLIFRARRALAQGLEQDADAWKRRLRRGADVGGAIACVKTLLGGGGAAAIKIAGMTAVVATATVAAATAPVAHKHPRAQHAAKPRVAAATRHRSMRAPSSTRASAATTIAPAAAKPAGRIAKPHAESRSIPRPIPIDTSSPQETAPATAIPETVSTSTDAPALALTAAQSEPAPAAPPTAPEPQPPAADPPPQPEPRGPSNKPDRPDKSDHSDNGNGNGNGHGKDHK